MYTAYTDNEVFTDGNANIACNLLNEVVSTQLETDLDKIRFFLTGLAARIVQGATPEPVTVISFGTDSDAAFKFCCNSIAKLIGAQGSVNLSDQARITYNDNILIEVWYLPTPGTLITIDAIVMQDADNIPPYIDNDYV